MRNDTIPSNAAAGDRGRAAVDATLNKFLPFAGMFIVFGLGGAVAGWVMDQKAFYTSYMFAFAFWMSLTMGFTTLTYLHHCIRATWSLSFLRVIEAGNRTLLVMGVFWLPLLFGVASHHLYEWTNVEKVMANPVLLHKSLYLNPTAWIVRGVIYFIFWLITTNILNKSSLLQDETHDERLAAVRASQGAGFGVAHVILLTFAATDWYMSLDPIWYSTIYGVIYMIAGVLAATALGVFFLTTQYKKYPFSEIVTPALTRNLGNMLLGFTMFWAYTSLSQFLIQWSANLPEEISFYAQRFVGPLVVVGAAIIIFQFVTPFLVLLSGRTKRTYDLLWKVAALILIMRAVDAWWQITPFFRHGFTGADLSSLALDLGVWAGMGGVWTMFFIYNLKKFPLLATHDPRLLEAKVNAHA